MNQHVTQPAFERLIPPMPSSAKELAKQALRSMRLFRELEQIEPPLSGAQWRRLDDAQIDAASAFFAALERETGIDRALFRELGEL